MSSSQNEPQMNLEDRLRGLILKNAGQAMVPSDSRKEVFQSSEDLPPHLAHASSGEKQEYLESRRTREATQRTQTSSPSSKQKRPNQAQRRQMNAQMSIPIDPRPSHHTQAGRSPGFGEHANSPRHNQGWNQQQKPYQQQYSPRSHEDRQSPRQQPFSARTSNFQQSFQNSSQSSAHPNHGSRQQTQGMNNVQAQHNTRSPIHNRQRFHQGGGDRGRQFHHSDHQDIPAQVSYLESLVHEWVPKVAIEPKEAFEKEQFRAQIEKICQDTIAEFERTTSNSEFDAGSVELQCFGSMKSGFATRASDMDLALLAPFCNPDPHSPESRIPRLLEEKLLAMGYGARLLTRTRVPIIKLCQNPTDKLLADLREARLKWDTGALDEVDEIGNEKGALVDDQELPPSPKKTRKNSLSTTKGQRQLETLETSAKARGNAVEQESPKLSTIHGDSQQAKLHGLKQQSQQSLQDHHNSAKRLLRKLGGRDITANSPQLNEQEALALDDVCRAFVEGLRSEELSQRLRNYHTIRILFQDGPQHQSRSLHSIWTQAEGERLAMAFEQRPFIEHQDRLEQEAANAVEAWFQLQEKSLSVQDAGFFGRQLHAAVERLKKITSLQILFLEQSAYEEPTAYHSRVQKMQQTLHQRKEQISPDSMEQISKFVVDKYIQGINNSSIRDTITAGTLSDVYRQHLKLQLALDYEHALELAFFQEKDIPVVQSYIEILRSDDNNAADDDLKEKMQTLPDPTLISTLTPRDPYKDKLEFPKADIGIQCDINFSAHLAIHNTLLLRCYAASDIRVQPMILFVKTWAKVRGINIPYRGTLSSYGYVLMVLHYLTNIAQPFVCANLQLVNKDPPEHLTPSEKHARSVCEGRDVRFWRNETEIRNLAERGMLNHNKDLLGFLLRGFFEYYAQSGLMTTVRERGFDWGREVLSLRTPGGIVSKQEKGWTGAKTVVETSTIAAPPTPEKQLDDPQDEAKASSPVKTMEETKEIRYRYLFAIEDPFELDHNVARTVTHNGIVSIRDEFRRAWRIIKNVGKPGTEGLMDSLPDGERKNGLKEAMEVIHGSAHVEESRSA